MSIANKAWIAKKARIGTALYFTITGLVLAQAPAAPAPAPAAAPKATAQSEAGEPRADTSNAPAAPSPAAASPPAPASAAPLQAPGSPGASGTPAAARKSAVTAAKPVAKTDRLDLGVATVTGEREQPKVMYIVPWKKSDIGDMTGRPMNSLVDEILSPVDRDVFKREVIYYQAVQAVASQNGASAKPPQQGEK